jgi:hypothetical protein
MKAIASTIKQKVDNRAGAEELAVTPRVTLFPNYLQYKLSQASSAMVNQVIEVRNQNSKSGVQISSFKFYLVWTDILSQQIFKIYRSRIRPCSQERIYSP